MAEYPGGDKPKRPLKDRPKVQAQRVERLERRQEAGKDINEARLEKLRGLAGGDDQIDKWLDKAAQSAVQNAGFNQQLSVLSGPGGEGMGSPELINYLRENPELATQVRAWLKENGGPISGAGGLQTQLFEKFPQLRDVYMEATGNWIKDENGEWRYDYRNLAENRRGTEEETAVPPVNALGFGQIPREEAAAAFGQAFGGYDDETLTSLGSTLNEMLLSRQRRLAAQSVYFSLAEMEEVE